MNLGSMIIGALGGFVGGYVLHDPIRRTKDRLLDATIGHPVDHLVESVRHNLGQHITNAKNRVAAWKEKRAGVAAPTAVAAPASLNANLDETPTEPSSATSVKQAVAQVLAEKYIDSETNLDGKVVMITGQGEDITVEVIDKDLK